MLKRYVINLDRSTDRLQHVTKMFESQGLDFIRVAAVDGRALNDAEFARLTAVCNWNKKLTHGEVGCFLSHRECLRLIAQGDEPFGAVFEDDIILSPHAHLFLKDWSWVPGHVDMVKLDTAKIRVVIGKIDCQLPMGYSLGRLFSKHYCTGGYIISKAAAARFYEMTAQVTVPIDEFYFNPACGVLQTTNVQQMSPAIIVQDELESTIRAPKVEGTKHTPSKLPLSKKIKRELARAELKYFWPIRMKLFKQCRWGVIPFK